MNQRDCFESEEELNIYLDAELDSSRKDELDRHIKFCVTCSQRFEIARQLKLMLKSAVGRDKAPAWLKDKIRLQIEEESRHRSGAIWWYFAELFRSRPIVPVGVATALVVLFFLVIFIRPSPNGTMPLVTEMVHEHYEYLEGITGFGIKSENPEEITGWLMTNGSMKFPFKNSADMPSLKGACIIKEDDENIGYVAFDYQEKTVSLFILNEEKDEIFGQRKMDIGDISVYCGKCTGMSYALWKGGDTMYILVGDLPEESLVDLARHTI